MYLTINAKYKMRLFLYSIIIAICNISLVSAQTIIPDNAEVSGKWTKTNSPYIINGIATISENDSLIIEPGVEIHFKTGTDNSFLYDGSVNVGLLYIKGTLKAEGTFTDNIVFTRQGTEGSWGCVIFHSNADINSIMNYCVVEYANSITYLENKFYYGAVGINNRGIKLYNSKIIKNYHAGIYVEKSKPEIINNVIAENKGYGINLNNGLWTDTVKIYNNTIIGNENTALYDSGICCRVLNCIFWGNRNSFYISNCDVFVSNSLVQEDALSNLSERLNLSENVIYNIDPQLKSDYSLALNSPCINNGIINLSGLNIPDQDLFGNNRINLNVIDIGASEFKSKKYIRITTPKGREGYFSGTSHKITWKGNLEKVKLEYTINGLDWELIDDNIENIEIYNWNVVGNESTSCVIRISDVSDSSIFDECDDTFSIISSIIPNNTILSGKLTLEKSPYIVNGIVTVPMGDSLIIDPGVEIKFKTGYDIDYNDNDSIDVGVLYVKGKLIANGTCSDSITFTRQGNSRYWGCIAFNEYADEKSIFRYCNIKYANQVLNLDNYSYHGAVGISSNNKGINLFNSCIINNKSSGISSQGAKHQIVNNIIAFNQGNGICFEDGLYKDTAKIFNNTIVGNEEFGIYTRGVRCQVINDILWNNNNSFYTSNGYTNVSYSVVQELVLPSNSGWLKAGKGMIYKLDPQMNDPDNLDFHLLSTSPCIDAGDPKSSFTNEPGNNGNLINIGAYGNTQEATVTMDLPRIRYMSIREGRMSGYDTITIKGVNFLDTNDQSNIKLHYTDAEEYLYWSDDSIVFLTPPVKPGIVDIKVINDNNEIGFTPGVFEYKPPFFTNVDPIFTQINGNEQVIFNGKFFGFEKKTNQVFFNSNEALSYEIWNDTIVTLRCPQGIQGLADLTFRVNDTVYYKKAESFYYANNNVIEVCGNVNGTWKNGETYLLNCTVTIPVNEELTIEPGVIVIANFNETDLISFEIKGTLNAIGIKNDSILFLSIPSEEGYWQGCKVTNNANLDFCNLRYARNGIQLQGGALILANSQISNCTNAGINLSGDEVYSNIEILNTKIIGNKYGIYGFADCNAKSGSIIASVNSSIVENNSEDGICLYSTGSTDGYSVPYSKSSSIYMNIENSVISSNQNYAMKINSFGYIDYDYIPNVHRYGNVDLEASNCIITNNDKGILAQRNNSTHCTLKAKFYNSTFWNNNSIIEMDADEIFLINTSLWDNYRSGTITGLADDLNIYNCNLNSLENTGQNNLSINPMYINPENGDFHLQESSPNINSGLNEYVTTDNDFDNKTRIWNSIVDIGAYEYGAPCYSITEEIIICSGDDYLGWIEPGQYQQKLLSVSGCDSIITTNLIVNQVSNTTEYISICEGETYEGWDGEGEYQRTLASVTGCDSIVTTNLTIHLPIHPEIMIDADTLKSVNEYQAYQWCDNNGVISCETGSQYVIKKSGDYYLVVEDVNGCMSTSDVVNVIKTDVVIYDESSTEYSIIPNPNKGKFCFKIECGICDDVELKLIDASGQLIEQRQIWKKKTGHQEQFDISHLSKGIYHLLISSEGNNTSRKIVVQ